MREMGKSPKACRYGGGRMRTAEKTVGYGFVGEWNDGTLGWNLPQHVDDSPCAREPSDHWQAAGLDWNDRAVLCKITVEAVRDKRGRLVTRRRRKS